MHDAYAHMNAETALVLLSAAAGRAHMQRAATLALEQVGEAGPLAQSLFLLGRNLHLCALESDPLDAAAISLVLSMDHQHEFLDKALRADLHAAQKKTRLPGDLRYLKRLAKHNQASKLETYLSAMTAKEPDNLFWLRHLHSLRMVVGNFSGAMQIMSSPLLKDLKHLRLRLSADILFQLGKYDRAADTYRAVLAAASGGMFWIQARLRLAEALHRGGDTPQAVAVCARMLREFPWHTNAALRLHEYRASLAGRIPSPPCGDGWTSACTRTTRPTT